MPEMGFSVRSLHVTPKEAVLLCPTWPVSLSPRSLSMPCCMQSVQFLLEDPGSGGPKMGHTPNLLSPCSKTWPATFSHQNQAPT